MHCVWRSFDCYTQGGHSATITVCLWRGMSCQYSCGTGGITAALKIVHESYHCPERLIQCPHGCGQVISHKSLTKHIQGNENGFFFCNTIQYRSQTVNQTIEIVY